MGRLSAGVQRESSVSARPNSQRVRHCRQHRQIFSGTSESTRIRNVRWRAYYERQRQTKRRLLLRLRLWLELHKGKSALSNKSSKNSELNSAAPSHHQCMANSQGSCRTLQNVFVLVNSPGRSGSVRRKGCDARLTTKAQAQAQAIPCSLV